jgi:hypothetical protein
MVVTIMPDPAQRNRPGAQILSSALCGELVDCRRPSQSEHPPEERLDALADARIRTLLAFNSWSWHTLPAAIKTGIVAIVSSQWQIFFPAQQQMTQSLPAALGRGGIRGHPPQGSTRFSFSGKPGWHAQFSDVLPDH